MIFGRKKHFLSENLYEFDSDLFRFQYLVVLNKSVINHFKLIYFQLGNLPIGNLDHKPFVCLNLFLQIFFRPKINLGQTLYFRPKLFFGLIVINHFWSKNVFSA